MQHVENIGRCKDILNTQTYSINMTIWHIQHMHTDNLNCKSNVEIGVSPEAGGQADRQTDRLKLNHLLDYRNSLVALILGSIETTRQMHLSLHFITLCMVERLRGKGIHFHF